MKWLLAVDITDPRPEIVVDEAIRWASRAGATLDLVHIEGARYTYEFVTDPYVRDLMAALLQHVPAEHRGTARLLPGRPVPAIVDAADPYDAVLISTHGRTGLAHFWLGSVAEQVVRRCHKPVLVLRIPHAAS